MSRRKLRHVIVIGASMAGLAAARVLSDHADAVTIVDRDELPDGADARRGVPQGRHAHALLGGGARVLEELFPGLMAEMKADGAGAYKFNDGAWHQAGGYRTSSLLTGSSIGATRPFLEGHVRRRVAMLDNVRIQGGVVVERLLLTGDRVRGARLFDGCSSWDVDADLVVDCSGRNSQAAHWLQEVGFPAPVVMEVRCDIRYATMVLRRSPGDLDGTFAVVIESAPHGKRAGFALPVEDDRWIVTLASSFGAAAPHDEEGFHAVAASLPAPEISQVLAVAEPLTGVTNHRMPTSKRRLYEKMACVPAGFVALGDAICSFNPVYAQGMSSAVMQAAELGACLAAHDNDQGLVRDFYRRAAKVIATPWTIAVGADRTHAESNGRVSIGTRLFQRYLRRALVAAHVSPEINTALLKLQNLLAPPASILRPSMILAVRKAARAAERGLSTPPARVATAPVQRRAA